MKNKLLIITRFPDNYKDIIESKYNEYELIWLQLWPVTNNDEIISNCPTLKVIKSSDLTTNEDHFDIAKEVTNISNNWWNILDLNRYGKEWNINGLKISQIFAYEIEQILTRILFQHKQISKAISLESPHSVLFIDKKFDAKLSNELLNSSINFSLYQYFKELYNDIDISQILLSETIVNRNKNKIKIFYEKLVNKKPSFFLKLISQKLFSVSKKKKDCIVISNSLRCLHQFEKFSKNNNIYIQNDSLYVKKNNSNDLILNLDTSSSIKNTINFSLFTRILPVIESKFYNLKTFYKNISFFIKENNPQMYVTVNIANSIELVKLWAYKQNKVRSVWSSEGLGQPDSDLDIIINSVIHPEIDIERWVISDLFSKKFSKNIMPVRVTGFLGSNIYPKYISTNKKQILFPLSSAKKFVRRAIVGEDMFEILQSIKNVSSVVSDFKDYELIIKIHPTDTLSIPLYKLATNNNKNVKIILSGNINEIIYQSNLVIVYEGSVATEALGNGKNVICYNYTNRPSYITSIYEHVNHDPKKGAALKMAHTKQELSNEIKNLLNYSGSDTPSPNLDFVLENLKKGYDVKKVVADLINKI